MSFNPAALTDRTLKQFVDRLVRLRKSQPCPASSQWPPKRSRVQEEVASILGFDSWHEAIHQVRASHFPRLPLSGEPGGFPADEKATAAPPPGPGLVEREIPVFLAEALAPIKQGLVVVGGRVGAGKTTLLSAIARNLIETRSGRRIVTFESPPLVQDYTQLLARAHAQRGGAPNRLTNYPPQKSHRGPSATEILHVQPRRPTDIFVGEATSADALLAATTAAMTGHTVYVEFQRLDVGRVLSGMIEQFEAGERAVRSSDIVPSLQACIAIHPVKGVSGARVDLIEALVMDIAAADRLMASRAAPGGVGHEARQILKERGMDFVSVARRHHENGIISEKTLMGVVELMGSPAIGRRR